MNNTKTGEYQQGLRGVSFTNDWCIVYFDLILFDFKLLNFDTCDRITYIRRDIQCYI